MNSKNLSDQVRLDAFQRDLALALRRIFGREVDLDSSQLPQRTDLQPTRLPVANDTE